MTAAAVRRLAHALILVLVLVLALAPTTLVLAPAPAQAQAPQPCVTTDITPVLWPKADFPVAFHPTAESSLATIPRPLDNGALRRDADGCLEILRGPGIDGPLWVRYDPSNFDHWRDASAFNRFGRGYSHGHAHGDDGIALIAYSIWPTLFGRPATIMDEFDTRYRVGSTSCKTGGRRWWVCDLMKEYATLTGEGGPPKDCGDGTCDPRLETPTTCPADCKAPIPQPEPEPKPEPPQPEPEPECPPCPSCPACPAPDATTCIPFTNPLHDDLATCRNDKQDAISELVKTESARQLCEDTNYTLRNMLAFKPPLPDELRDYLAVQRAAATGLGRKARYRRLAGPVCDRFNCPTELRP